MNWRKFENWQEAMDTLESRCGERTIIRYMSHKQVVEVKGEQFYGDVHKHASAIVRLGLQGKHIGLIGNNSYEILINLCAVLYTGSVAVVISKDYTPAEIKLYAEISELDALIYDPKVEDACTRAGLGITMISIKETSLPGAFSMAKESEKELLEIVNPTKRDDFTNILFTSGTTGLSKAVMHSNGSLMSGCFPTLFYEEYSAGMVMFPFHHIAGYGFSLICLCQEKVICMGNGPTKLLTYLEYLKPDCIFVVPALLQIIVQKLKKHSMEELGWKLRMVVCGGAKFPAALLGDAIEQGLIARQIYGASESIGRGITCRMDVADLNTLGEVDSLMEAKLVDGELALKGPTVCMGYYNNPVESAETFIDGWYYTGDLARIDENGKYYLTGRKKNLIILSNGENVSPEEIEQILSEHEEIREILVHEEGDVIGAVIYPDYELCKDEDERDSLKDRVRQIIEEYNYEAMSYKQIRNITVTDEPLPKTASSKIKRY